MTVEGIVLYLQLNNTIHS